MQKVSRAIHDFGNVGDTLTLPTCGEYWNSGKFLPHLRFKALDDSNLFGESAA
jgi:hypothetical protein